MPRYADKPGQIGDYWLSQRENSAAWCRTWFDARSGQVRRRSLKTDDFEEARTRLAAWFIENHRVKNAASSEALLSGILTSYYERHAKTLTTADQASIAIDRFMAFWPGESVEILTLSEQERYVDKRTKEGAAKSTISRELMVLRAALKDAIKRQELFSAPAIKEILTREDRDAAEPKGRPLSVEETAKLFKVSAHDERRMMLLMILFGTLCRPDAARDLAPAQYDPDHGILNLNPAGRRQTKKYRPTIPVATALAPWLGLKTRPHYIGTLTKRVKSIKTMWRRMRRDAKLDAEVNPYSARHTIARYLRTQRVPSEQIEIMLGHRRPSHGTTGIYAPYDPDYCRDAVAAIDAFFGEVEAVLGPGYFRKTFETIKEAARLHAQKRL